MNSELPFHLYNANAELQSRITGLLQESGQHWLGAIQQLGAGSEQETAARIQGLEQAADWQALATFPSGALWHLCLRRVVDAQKIGQAAAKSQATFADGLRQALTIWQGAVGEAFGASADTAAITRFCQQWTTPWSAPASIAPQDKAEK